MKYLILIYYTLFGLSAHSQHTFNEMVDGLISKEVNVISVVALHELIKSENNIVLFDARERQEYAVSDITGAHHCGYDEFSNKLVKKFDKADAIVVYCSVGYRSDKIAKKLLSLGFTNVRNLYGGIFDWVNTGYPVYTDKGKTNRIHGYNQKWGKWLKKGEKVF